MIEDAFIRYQGRETGCSTLLLIQLDSLSPVVFIIFDPQPEALRTAMITRRPVEDGVDLN